MYLIFVVGIKSYDTFEKAILGIKWTTIIPIITIIGSENNINIFNDRHIAWSTILSPYFKFLGWELIIFKISGINLIINLCYPLLLIPHNIVKVHNDITNIKYIIKDEYYNQANDFSRVLSMRL